LCKIYRKCGNAAKHVLQLIENVKKHTELYEHKEELIGSPCLQASQSWAANAAMMYSIGDGTNF
jgi:hypothetical protein